MNILQLVDSLHSGGAERMALSISHLLKGKNYNVILCATRSGGALEKLINKDLPYFKLYKKHILDLKSFNELTHLIKQYNIQVVHAHSSSVIWGVGIKVLFPKVRLIWHDHNGARAAKPSFQNLLYKAISFKIDGIITVNEDLLDWSRKNMKLPQEKIVLLHNFPEEAVCQFLEEKKQESFINIICVSNLRYPKDHFTLVRALSLAKHKLKGAKQLKLFLVGAFPDEEYHLKLSNLIDELVLENEIELMGSRIDVMSLVQQSDIAVLSSTSEGLPVTLLEYGLARKPVVVTDVGQCAKVVNLGKGGWLIPKSNPEQFAEAILEAISKPDIAIKKADFLHQSVKKYYSGEAFAKGYKELLKVIGLNEESGLNKPQSVFR